MTMAAHSAILKKMRGICLAVPGARAPAAGGFADHFSRAAASYAAFRPRYPSALFDFLAWSAPGLRRAWDCATGNGQAALGLAAHFEAVVASDPSAAQLAAALPHPRVRYVQSVAEASGLRALSVDLVAVAQALHWLDRPAFFEEARRVLTPRGVVAAWCYGLMLIEPGLDDLVRSFYATTVGPYWPPGRELIESGYAMIDFPFEEVPAPPLRIKANLTCEEVAGYLRTWSATLRFREATGRDPVEELLVDLGSRWGDPGARRAVRWPLSIRAGRVR